MHPSTNSAQRHGELSRVRARPRAHVAANFANVRRSPGNSKRLRHYEHSRTFANIREHSRGFRWNPRAFVSLLASKENPMVEDREKISTGPNEEPINETIAGTGPGIPDEALAPGEELPEPPSDEETARIAQKLGATVEERDTLPLEGE